MKNLKDMIGKSIINIPCKHCGSTNTLISDDDPDVEVYDDGTGHRNFNCHCDECGKDFYVLFGFKYQIESAEYY